METIKTNSLIQDSSPEEQMAVMASMIEQLQAQLTKPKTEVNGLNDDAKELGLNGHPSVVNDLVNDKNPLTNHVFVIATDEMCNRTTKISHKTAPWTKANNRHVPPNYKENAQKFVLDILQIPCVDSYLFLPTSKDEIISLHDETYYNTFSDRYYPSLEDYSTGDKKDAVERVESHLRMLYGEEQKNIVLDFVAHNVQFPGKKILWALCLYGSAQGTGKSLPIALCEAALGTRNIHKVPNDAINSEFTTWTQGGCVAFCDEIELKGSERNRRLSTLKDVVGNPRDVSYIPKGKDAITCPNTQNYIFTTNKIDALPLEEADRRWCVLDDEVDKCLVKIHNHIGLHEEEDESVRRDKTVSYFNVLYEDITTHAGAIRKWLLDRDLSHFKAEGRAPESKAKAHMVEASRDIPYATIKDILEEGFNPEVVIANYLLMQFKERPGVNFEITGQRLAHILRELGYESLGRAKIGGKNQTVFKHTDSKLSDEEAVVKARDSGFSYEF